MFPDGFDPESLSAAATLNKALVIPLPEPLHDLDGRTGGELLSRDAALELAAAALSPTDPIPPDQVAHVLDAALRAEGPAGIAAQGVVDEMARRFAALVASLVMGARAADAGAEIASERQAWAVVRSVTVGGGLLHGAVGPHFAAHASAHLARLDPPMPDVRLGAHPSLLALIGAARTMRASDGEHVVIDAGQTSIKRGIATVEGGALVSLRLLASVAVEGAMSGNELAGVLIEAVEDAAAARTRSDGSPGPLVVSVASYVRNGRPSGESPSLYESLAPVIDDVERRLDRSIWMVHDGTAAARAMDTREPTATVVLGTWLGIGFGPQAKSLLPYSSGFAIQR